MKTVNFSLTKTNSDHVIEGVFTEFKSGAKSIVLSEKLSISTPLSFDLEKSEPIENIGNFIAAFVQSHAMDTFDYVVIDDDETEILHSDYHKNKMKETLKTVYKSGHIVIENIDQEIETADGNIVYLSELMEMAKFTDIDVPMDGKYSKNPVINAIFSDNFAPYDVDRKFVKGLNNLLGAYEAYMKKENKDTQWFVLCSIKRKEVNPVSEAPEKLPSYRLALKVKMSHFSET